jgi:hypothetical protein
MRRARVALIAVVMTSLAAGLQSAPVAVRHSEGIVHGFLALRTLEGRTIADGDLIQTARGDRVTARLVFRFRDGSLHDETAVYTQRGLFRLVSDHLMQKGPTFPRPIDVAIDATNGQVSVRYWDEGKEKTESERMEVPADLANGLILTMIKNLDPATPSTSFSYIAATPKPRLVKLQVAPSAQERFSTGGLGRRATHYVVKVDIGGLTGVIAELLGKDPPDSHVWILGGAAPAFVKAEQALYLGGPIWRIELVSPTWLGGGRGQGAVLPPARPGK